MRRYNSIRLSLAVALVFAFAAVLVPHSAGAQTVSKTAMAGKYSVNLKVLPAEAFKGSDAAMVHNGGAMAEAVKGPAHPNHHMVVFIKMNHKPVEQAHVKIWYRMTTANKMDSGAMDNKSGPGAMGGQSMMGNKGGSHMANTHSAKMADMDSTGKWMTLPVARMYVKGKGAATTHFGNNVMLESGNYEVKVEVNGKTAMFHFTL